MVDNSLVVYFYVNDQDQIVVQKTRASCTAYELIYRCSTRLYIDAVRAYILMQ